MQTKRLLKVLSGLVLSALLGVSLISSAHAQLREQNDQNKENDATQNSQSSQNNTDRVDGVSNDRVFNPTTVAQDAARTSQTLADPLSSNVKKSLLERNDRQLAPPEPGEFQVYVERVTGLKIPVFGADLILPENRDFAVPATATVPPDYRINVGDTVAISVAGSIEGSFERTVDTDGNIFLPNVGVVRVAGVRQGDLRDHMARAIGTQFRNFRVGARVAQLRGIRVFVTGFANNPGAYTVSSLSSLANAVLQAGGPSSGGSMRQVKLIRDGQEIGQFDLYELIRGGSRVKDFVLENEDVLLIPPVGRQVAVFGSVNQEAIFELLPNETVADVVDLAGGINSLGDPSRVMLYRSQPDGSPGPRELSLEAARSFRAVGGDLIQVLSIGSLVQPLAKQSVIVRVEGEVERPGNYFVPANTSLQTVIEQAGGLTPRAFIFGTQFKRESVRAQQRESFLDAIDQVELAVASSPLNADSSTALASQQTQLAAATAVLKKLRDVEPDGRLVLNLDPLNTVLPGGLILENNDHIYIPPQPKSVGVFGAVYRPASFMTEDQPRRVRDFINLAGGTVRAADKGNIFLVRANGEVLTRERGAMSAPVTPGDVIFVPVKVNRTDLLGRIAQFSSVLFQLGLAAATVMAIN